ncbi:acylneuraminate cytidylyltransferase [Candidatus Marinamargulisbacteria bacterium SCGC AG-333-B06]|nr:acylneuraminate cytidylyltransferase [Candidatus Marinamargulisbacteria bacterium SCGC AG-333-B06]
MSRCTAFLPCRKGSQRIPNKNIKPFAEHKKGLLEIKLNQLQDSRYINKIILSTNDSDIIKFAKRFPSKKLFIDHRSDSLCSSETSTDDLISYIPSIISSKHILWTHVTSPFIHSLLYDKIIKMYFNSIKDGYDSLMTVTKHQNFFWDNTGPVNYNCKKEKWPRTQTLKKLYEINSAIFLTSINCYKKYKNRIGKNPIKYPLNKLESTDIDWPEDFHFAELLWQNINSFKIK